MTTLLHADIRALGYCNRGSRKWFRDHGLDWAEFMQNGIDVRQLAHIDDAMVTKAVNYAKAREAS